MIITLDESLEEAVRRRALVGGYPSADEYVQAVVMAELSRAAKAEIAPMLSPETLEAIQKGLDSGPGIIADDAYWEAKHRRFRESQTGA